MGVRFVDIRLRKKGILQAVSLTQEPLYVLKVYHGITEQELFFADVLKICNNFLLTNPKETIFMSVKDVRALIYNVVCIVHLFLHYLVTRSSDFRKEMKRRIRLGRWLTPRCWQLVW